MKFDLQPIAVRKGFDLIKQLPEHSRYQEFFKAADQALYKAKNRGKNEIMI